MTQWTPADPQAWEMTRRSLMEDGETGARFLVFLNFWLNTAEKIMTEPPREMTLVDPNASAAAGKPVFDTITVGSPPLPANAVRSALEIAEKELGFIDVWFLGQLLVVIAMYWVHGDDFARGLSPIELKLAGEGLAYKIHDLQETAIDADAVVAPQEDAPADEVS